MPPHPPFATRPAHGLRTAALFFFPYNSVRMGSSHAAPRGQPSRYAGCHVGTPCRRRQGERLWPLTRDAAKQLFFRRLYRSSNHPLEMPPFEYQPRFHLTQYKALRLKTSHPAGGRPSAGPAITSRSSRRRDARIAAVVSGHAAPSTRNIYSIGSARSTIVSSSPAITATRDLQPHAQADGDSAAAVHVATIEITRPQARNSRCDETDRMAHHRIEEKGRRCPKSRRQHRDTACCDGNYIFKHPL